MNDKAKYVSVDEEQNNRILHLRDVFSYIYDEIERTCKPGRETSLVFTKLEEAQFWAIKGITREKQYDPVKENIAYAVNKAINSEN